MNTRCERCGTPAPCGEVLMFPPHIIRGVVSVTQRLAVLGVHLPCLDVQTVETEGGVLKERVAYDDPQGEANMIQGGRLMLCDRCQDSLKRTLEYWMREGA